MLPIREMYWAAEYNNGQALPELDPTTGLTNRYEWVDHKSAIRLWWLPITPAMARQFPGTRHNPRLQRHAVELHGAKGFVARRTQFELSMGKEPPLEKARRLLASPPVKVQCYVLGIEGGPRREIYPDGRVVSKEWPDKGETQVLLHG